MQSMNGKCSMFDEVFILIFSCIEWTCDNLWELMNVIRWFSIVVRTTTMNNDNDNWQQQYKTRPDVKVISGGMIKQYCMHWHCEHSEEHL